MNVLKKCKIELSAVLANLFSKSFRSGVVPSQMKSSRIVPIYKNKGDPLDCANYRGICLIEVVGKVLEKIVQQRLYAYLETNKLIYKGQYGFRKSTGTDHCILSIINKISKAFNDDQMASVLSLDVQKAFDIVNWNILFKKLEHYGIKGRAHRWLQSYFTNRTSQVTVNGINGKTICSLLRGVCQGSCLGPLLFLIFINDLPNCLTEASSVLFADDNQVFSQAADINTLSTKINSEIKNLVYWYALNRLPIHPGKTSLTFFMPHKLNKKFKIPLDQSGGCTLRIVTDFNFDTDNFDPDKCHPVHITNLHDEADGGVKILGITIDPHLNFKHQAKLTSSKVKSSIFALKRSKNFLKIPELLKLYHAFVRSHLNYITPFLTICQKETLHSLNMVDRAALRSVFGIGMMEPITYKYKENKILP